MNNASPENNKKPHSAQEQLTQLIAYKQQLNLLLEDTQEKSHQLNRQLQRQQTLVAAALNIEETNRQKLKAEQVLLNELEEQNKAALLELAAAKQKSVQALHNYNDQLELIKNLHNHLEEDTAATQSQQETIKNLMSNWQSSNFFLQKQQTISQELERRLNALRQQWDNTPIEKQDELPPLEFDDSLPLLSELTPPALNEPEAEPAAGENAAPADSSPNASQTPAEGVSVGKSPHANANFWEAKQHAYLKLNNQPTAPAAEEDAAAPTEGGPEAEADEAAAEQEPVQKKRLPWKSYLLCIILALLVALAIRTWLLLPTQVSGSSMQPTLQPDDKVLTSPVPYWLHSPQRGDVVVFQAPSEPDGVFYVKRVIGLAGEHLQILDGKVYINSLPLNEPYIESSYTGGYIDTLVPDNCVFVMGDNREVSHDSRDSDVSFIDISSISGQALWRIYPFADFGAIE